MESMAGRAGEPNGEGLEAAPMQSELRSRAQGRVTRLRESVQERSFERYVRAHVLAVFPLVSRLLGVRQESLRVSRRSLKLGWELGLASERELRALAMRAALDRVREMHRGGVLPLEELLPDFDAEGCHAAPPCPRSPEGLRELAGSREIRALIGRLPEPYRTVLLLRDCAGATAEETALVLSIDEKGVALLLHPARLALRGLIERTLVR